MSQDGVILPGVRVASKGIDKTGDAKSHPVDTCESTMPVETAPKPESTAVKKRPKSSIMSYPPVPAFKTYNALPVAAPDELREALPVEEPRDAEPVQAADQVHDTAPTRMERISEFLLKAEHRVLQSIGLPSAKPYLTLMRKQINRLEEQFIFTKFPLEARQTFENLLKTGKAGEEASPDLSAPERLEVEKLLRGEPVSLTKLPDAAFPLITSTFKMRLAAGEAMNDLIPESFAVAREATRRTVFMRPFDVQITGGIALYHGKIDEMGTGEGKTLAAVAPAYLRSLAGEGVHVITVNDYLAKRDAAWMGPAYRLLGVSVGVVSHELSSEQKRQAYQRDITYITNHDVIFDYLRDNLAYEQKDRVQRGLSYAIVDELDLILIDEARTPFIISAPVEEGQEDYKRFAELVDGMTGYEAVEEDKQHHQVSPKIEEEYDYIVYPKSKQVVSTTRGLKRVEDALGVEDLYSIPNMPLAHYLHNALRAKGLYKEGVHYIKNSRDEIQLVDEFTGRILANRRYSEGLHQAIEAKEGVPIKPESRTTATITVQNFFKMYKVLSGMTGTALTEAKELWNSYGLEVMVIPPNKPSQRIDHPDVVYKSKEEKWRAATANIVNKYLSGQPVLVGSRSIEDSEDLAGRLSPAMLQKGALTALLLHALRDYDRNDETTQAVRDYLLQSLTQEEMVEGDPPVRREKVSMETLGTIIRDMQEKGTRIDPRMFTDENLDLLMGLWQIPDLSGRGSEEAIGDTERQLRHQSTRDRLREILKRGVPCEVLNAKYHEEEARIISQAGRARAVTIATNMAGRGTDIKLGGDPVAAFQEPLAQAITVAVRARFEAASPRIAQLFGRLLENRESVRINAGDDGATYVVIGSEVIPYFQIEADLRKIADPSHRQESDNDTFQQELYSFLMERKKYPMEFLRLFLPGNPSLDCAELLKAIVQASKGGSLWSDIRKDPKIQKALAETLGPIQDIQSIQGILSQLPAAVVQAAKEGERVKALGGLEILGTERHESRRIDNQLRGRSGRQGDPGESRFLISLEDEVPRLFGSERLKGMLERIGVADGEGVEHPLITKAITTAQEKVEGVHYEQREQLLKYDQAINTQREVIYKERDTILGSSDIHEEITAWMSELVAKRVDRMDQPVPMDPDFEDAKELILLNLMELSEDMREKIPAGNPHAGARYSLDTAAGLLKECFRGRQKDIREIFAMLGQMRDALGHNPPDTSLIARHGDHLVRQAEVLEKAQGDREIQLGMLAKALVPFVTWPATPRKELLALSKEELKELFTGRILERYAGLEAAVNGLQPGAMRSVEKTINLRALDEQWVAQLTQLDQLKDGIGFEASGGRDPVVMFKKYAYEGFERMLEKIKEGTIASLFSIHPTPIQGTPEPDHSSVPISGRG